MEDRVMVGTPNLLTTRITANEKQVLTAIQDDLFQLRAPDSALKNLKPDFLVRRQSAVEPLGCGIGKYMCQEQEPKKNKQKRVNHEKTKVRKKRRTTWLLKSPCLANDA